MKCWAHRKQREIHTHLVEMAVGLFYTLQITVFLQLHYCCLNMRFSVPTLAQMPKVTDVEILDTFFFSQHSWQKWSWPQRSEAFFNKKKLFKCTLFCKDSFSFRRPQSSASTPSWSPHSSAAVWSCSCVELVELFEPLQLIAWGVHQLLSFICFLELVLF